MLNAHYLCLFIQVLIYMDTREKKSSDFLFLSFNQRVGMHNSCQPNCFFYYYFGYI